MNKKLDLALNTLYQRQITSREQLLNEMLRVRMTLKQFEESTEVIGKDQLFQVMKSATEDELGFFPADREDFSEIYEALKAIEPLEFTLYIYQDDRMGTVISPLYLSRYICTRIKSLQPKTILIPEAEKHLSGLRDIITQSSTADLTLTTQLKPMYLLLKLAFGEHMQVKIKYESIYSECLLGEKYDYIYLLPAFGARPDEPVVFLTRDSDGVALENMLGHLTEQGTLDAIVPAKITFAGAGNEKLRSYITENFSVQSLHILPEGTFRPATAVKTYFLTVTACPQAKVDIGSLALNKETLAVTDKQSIHASKFKVQPDWRIELLLSEDDENIQRFRRSDVEKIKLKEVAEVFRGKSVLKRDTSPGSVAV
ncbi:MAG: restriction endonuclease subunit M/S, partial [Desulfitobacteriaceae bacterium]|nr:restriction endonuclease subunit M/S [Desulfitobacteriaceae bacterium]